MNLKRRNLVSLLHETYEADKPYYRRLIVCAIEDGIVLFLLFAACRSLAWAVGGILDKLGVGG